MTTQALKARAAHGEYSLHNFPDDPDADHSVWSIFHTTESGGLEVASGMDRATADLLLAALAPAPVEASGSEREHGPKCWGKTSVSDEMLYCYCGSTDLRPLALGGQHSTATDFPPDDVLACDTTPARAEAQDEGAAGERDHRIEDCAWRVRYGDSSAALFFLEEEADDSIAEHGGVKERMILASLNRHPSPTPAADADRVRIAVEALEPFAALAAKFGCWSMVEVCAPDPDNPSPVIAPVPLSAFETAAAVAAALKSTAAKEGG